MSEPETEVISCPACRHLLRVPLDWLGQQVQCPECKSMFRAPVRDGTGGLTAPELISRPASATPAGERKKFDAMLLLPAFGLMFCGVAGMIVNGVFISRMMANPPAAKDGVRQMMQEVRKHGFGADDPPGDRDRLDDERAEQVVGALRWVLPIAAALSAAAFLGGLSIALRWNRRLSQIGCVAASLNVPHLCCVPGAAAGLWGLLMLASEEGRAHFVR